MEPVPSESQNRNNFSFKISSTEHVRVSSLDKFKHLNVDTVDVSDIEGISANAVYDFMSCVLGNKPPNLSLARHMCIMQLSHVCGESSVYLDTSQYILENVFKLNNVSELLDVTGPMDEDCVQKLLGQLCHLHNEFAELKK